MRMDYIQMALGLDDDNQALRLGIAIGLIEAWSLTRERIGQQSVAAEMFEAAEAIAGSVCDDELRRLRDVFDNAVLHEEAAMLEQQPSLRRETVLNRTEKLGRAATTTAKWTVPERHLRDTLEWMSSEAYKNSAEKTWRLFCETPCEVCGREAQLMRKPLIGDDVNVEWGPWCCNDCISTSYDRPTTD